MTQFSVGDFLSFIVTPTRLKTRFKIAKAVHFSARSFDSIGFRKKNNIHFHSEQFVRIWA